MIYPNILGRPGLITNEMGFRGLRGTGEVNYLNCTRPICRRPNKQKEVDIFSPIYTHSVLSSA